MKMELKTRGNHVRKRNTGILHQIHAQGFPLFIVFIAIRPFCTASEPLEPGPLVGCLKSPETVLIDCRVLNVANAICVDNKTNIISIPQTPENIHGEINCTSPAPIDLFFDGYQLEDYTNTSFVRNAENVFNEATYVFSVSFPLAQITSPREVVVQRYNSPEHKMSFFIFRPGKMIFAMNLNPSFPTSQGEQARPQFKNHLEHTEKNLIIPCIANAPDITPTLEYAGSGPVVENVMKYDRLKGFIIKTDGTSQNHAGEYSCKADSAASKETVSFKVDPKKDAIFYPTQDKVYLFANSQLRISCKYGEPVNLGGTFRNRPIVTKPTILSDTSILPYESEYIEKIVKVGDSGEIQCKSNDDRILKTWSIETLDIHENPVVQLSSMDDNKIVCHSTTYPKEVKLEVVFCQGISNCKLNEFCFDKDKGKNCLHSKTAYPCQTSSQNGVPNRDNSLCISLPKNDSFSSQGMISCSAGNYSYQTNFFRGFDEKLYLDWETAPLSALIEIFVPNVTMYPHNSYPFGCKAVKFISDGRLQWVVRGKDGSEILLHKNRVQDLYKVYATPLDYSLYTVRESNIRLIYPNDYDIICMVPRWNATAWVRHHKRINVAAKEAPVAEIVSGASAVIIVLIGVVVYVMWRLKKAKEAIRNLTEKEVQDFLDGNPEALKNAGDKDTHEVIDSLPYDKKFEIPREKLLIDTENCLGKGAFGTVLKGRVEGISEVVAVKTVNSDCEVNRFKGFLSELKIMIFIGKHPNIVSLIGASTEKIKEKTLYIVVEFCANGSLEGHLRKHKGCFLDQIVDNEVQPGAASYENFLATSSASSSGMITTVDLIRWSYQTARGMEYLATKKVIHADLAARNVLVDCKGNAKITDFGLSRQLFDYTQYVKKQQEPLPWRWMAIESLQQLRFSTQSDVWAFGILLWEIFSVGDMPYPGLAWDVNFVQQLCNGLRLKKPPRATDAIYNLMLDCWQEIPEKRPSFQFISQYFKGILEGLNVELDATKEINADSAYANPLVPGYARVGDLLSTDEYLADGRKSTNIYVES